jgi:tRNA(fMet)-specific endonuclease VapC
LIYLLDTNTCIQYITDRNSIIVQRLKNQKRLDIALCDIVKLELYYGAYKSQRQQRNLEVLKEFFQEFISLPFDGNAAKICGQIRAQLAVLGTPIGPYDLQIAAIALVNSLTLVTHNTREFSRVSGLKLEDWEIDI